MHDSAWGRLIAVLVSPIRTFQSIAERPTWVPALVVLVALTIVSSVIVFQRIDMAEVIRDATAERGQQVTDEQIEQFAGIQSKIGFGCAILWPVAGYFIGALVLMAAFNIVGGEIKYPASLAVTLHGMMPWAVASVLAVPVVLSQQSLDYATLKNGGVLASSAAFLAPAETGPVLRGLLASLDVFSLWTAVLLAIGFGIAAKVSRARAAATVGVIWAIYIALKVGLAGLGAAFGGAGGG